MIQRIQSIYLLCVAVLMCVTVISPFATFVDDDGRYFQLESCGMILGSNYLYSTWGMCVAGLLSAGLAVTEIFCYKNRKRQLGMSKINTVLILLFYVVATIYACLGQREYLLEFESFAYGAILPIIALIFNLLAFVKIKKDEKLVRSLDRIR